MIQLPVQKIEAGMLICMDSFIFDRNIFTVESIWLMPIADLFQLNIRDIFTDQCEAITANIDTVYLVYGILTPLES